MHRLQELVRLHRLQTGARDCAQLLRMGPNTERRYRRALQEAGLLDGDPEELPPLDKLMAAVEEQLPKNTPQHKQSSAPARLAPQSDFTLDELPPDDAYPGEPPRERSRHADSRAPP